MLQLVVAAGDVDIDDNDNDSGENRDDQMCVPQFYKI